MAWQKTPCRQRRRWGFFFVRVACLAPAPEGVRDELLNGEIFYSLKEAQIIIESWRRHYNTIRPHASLGYKPPAPEVFVSAFTAWPAVQTVNAPTTPLQQRTAVN